MKEARKKRSYAPARTPETKENQMISMAFNLAEEKLRDGTASSQLITHFLKLATEREQLEKDRLRAELAVAEAKIDHMKSQVTSQKLYEDALKAFADYSGAHSAEEEDD